MKKLLVATVLAVCVALLVAGLFAPRSLDARIIQVQLEQASPELASELAPEPLDLQALFLAYADDPVLLVKARLALLRHGALARPVLRELGDTPGFQQALRSYGEDIVLPVHYFMENEIATLALMRNLGEASRAALATLRQLWGSAAAEEAASAPLDARERGLYAVHFLNAEGYDFLGQFVQGADGTVRWVQTERVLEGLNQLLASGIRGIETRYHRDEPIDAMAIGHAALDVAVGITAFKVLRMGRVAAPVAGTTQSLATAQRSVVLGAGLWRGSVVAQRLLKYGAPAVLAYMAVRHPSLINALFGSVAETLGLPVRWVQVVGWTLVLLPVFWALSFLLVPLAWVLGGAGRFLRGVNGWLSGARCTHWCTHHARKEKGPTA